MYELADYLAMVEDPVRTPAYLAAMREVIRPGDQVLELGTGFGYFAVHACRLGAAHVWAVEPNDAIAHGPALAAEHGCADRITFLQDLSERVTLPSAADVLLEDLRGVSPLHGGRLRALVDAHRRLLRPAARTIPLRDHLWCAPMEWPAEVGVHPSDADAELMGVRVAAVRRVAISRLIQTHSSAECLLAPARRWATLDYGNGLTPDLPTEGEATFRVSRAGRAAGIASWFAAELAPGIGFDTAPGGPRTVYQHAVLPLDEPFAVQAGDELRIRLQVVPDGGDYVWAWTVHLSRGDGTTLTRIGSSLGSRLLSAARRRRRAAGFVPEVTPTVERLRTLFSEVDGSRTLEAIAQEVRRRHPDDFESDHLAFTWASDRLAEAEEPRSA